MNNKECIVPNENGLQYVQRMHYVVFLYICTLAKTLLKTGLVVHWLLSHRSVAYVRWFKIDIFSLLHSKS